MASTTRLILMLAVLSVAAAVKLPGFGRNFGSRKSNRGRRLQDGRGSSNRVVSPIPGEPGKDYPVLATVPKTIFSCKRHIPGYYADPAPASRCQVFHICQEGGQQDSFLCPNGTVFNQQYFVCDIWSNVDCSKARQYYSLNSEIGKAGERNVVDQKVNNKGFSSSSDVRGVSTAAVPNRHAAGGFLGATGALGSSNSGGVGGSATALPVGSTGSGVFGGQFSGTGGFGSQISGAGGTRGQTSGTRGIPTQFSGFSAAAGSHRAGTGGGGIQTFGSNLNTDQFSGATGGRLPSFVGSGSQFGEVSRSAVTGVRAPGYNYQSPASPFPPVGGGSINSGQSNVQPLTRLYFTPN